MWQGLPEVTLTHTLEPTLSNPHSLTHTLEPALSNPLTLWQSRGQTEEGFQIYLEDDLKINLPGSGMTDDCPFDCDCCF